MNIPKDHQRFRVDNDPTAKLEAPGTGLKAKILKAGGTEMSKPPLKISAKGPIKIIQRDNMDSNSVINSQRGINQASGSALDQRPGSSMKMKLLKTESNLNLKDSGVAGSGAPAKLKLKIRPPSASKHDIKPPSRGATPTEFRRQKHMIQKSVTLAPK